MRRIGLLWLYLLGLMSLAFAQSPIYQVSFDNDVNAGETKDLISNTPLQIDNQFGRPERKPGIAGDALRLDGYSTWVSQNNFSITSPTNQIALELWYAPEAFNEVRAGLISQVGSQGGFALNVDPYGQVVFEFFADGMRTQVRSTQQLSRYEWHHIVAQADLMTGRASIYVDGAQWEDVAIPGSPTALTIPAITLYLGRRNAPVTSPNGFHIMTCNGLMDEVAIYDQTLSQGTIQAHYQVGAALVPDLSIDPYERFAGDHLRPRYHPMPNVLWANEAYGFTYYDSIYHLFFQKNPNHADLFFMHWGHLTSPDLVNWTEQKMALAPQEGFSDYGIWSGTTTFDDTGKPVISYTGVNGQFAGIGMAFPKDDSLIEWDTYQNGTPVIPRAPTSYNSLDFRDPYIWKSGNLYYMIVGSGVSNNGGAILATYTSPDLINWTETNPLYRNTDAFSTGIFWEMPTFFNISGNIWALVVTPVFSNKPADCIYWIGTWNGNAFTPFDPDFKRLEVFSQHMLAPAFGQDEAGRWTYVGIIPEDRDVNDQIDAGWRQTFSLPRVVRLLKDSLMGHYPHPNLCRLRTNPVSLSQLTVNEAGIEELRGFSGNQSEIEATFVPGQDANFSLRILQNPAKTEYTDIEFNTRLGRLSIDRRNSSPYPTLENNRFGFYTYDDTIRVQVFIDHSTVEVFVDNLAVMSARVYPGRDGMDMDVIAEEGSVEIVTITTWTLQDKESTTLPDSSCPPTFLPNGFGDFTTSIEAQLIPEELDLRVFPNPATDQIVVECQRLATPAPIELMLYNQQGEVMVSDTCQGHTLIDVSHCSPGIYALTIRYEGRQIIQKMIIR